jgi:hypothetical protein
MAGCLEVATNNFNEINDNPDNGRPRAQFWSEINCGGTQLPASLSDTRSIFQPTTSIKSCIIPKGARVTISPSENTNDPDAVVLPPVVGNQQYATFDLIIENLEGAAFRSPSGKHVLNPALISVAYDKTLADWKLGMCMGRLTTTYVDNLIDNAWSPGSTECDAYMTSFCETNPDATECGCKKAQAELQAATCGTFDGTPSPVSPATCDDEDSFKIFLNAACYDARCAGGEAYIFGNQRAPCNLQLCRQNIELIGDQLSRAGKSTLFCGNQTLAVTGDQKGDIVSVKTSTDVNLKTGNKVVAKRTPISLFVGIMLACFIVFIGLPILWVYRSRKQEQESRDKEDNESVTESQRYVTSYS